MTGISKKKSRTDLIERFIHYGSIFCCLAMLAIMLFPEFAYADATSQKALTDLKLLLAGGLGLLGGIVAVVGLATVGLSLAHVISGDAMTMQKGVGMIIGGAIIIAAAAGVALLDVSWAG